MDNNKIQKIILKYRTNGRKRIGRPLKGLLDEIDRSLKARLVTDDEGDDEINTFLSLVTERASK